MCVLSCFSHVRLFVTPWTPASQALLSMGILQARILEYVAISSSSGLYYSVRNTFVSVPLGNSACMSAK